MVYHVLLIFYKKKKSKKIKNQILFVLNLFSICINVCDLGILKNLLEIFRSRLGILWIEVTVDRWFVSVVEYYTARTEAVRFAAWVPGLTIVSRRRRWSQVIKVSVGLGEHGAANAMVVDHCMVDRVPTINRQTISSHRPAGQRPCYRCAVSSPGSSTSGLVYHCLNQGRN